MVYKGPCIIKHYNELTQNDMNKKLLILLNLLVKAAKFVQEDLELASSKVSGFRGLFIFTIKHQTTSRCNYPSFSTTMRCDRDRLSVVCSISIELVWYRDPR